MFGSKTQSLQQRAQKVAPLGVNSNFRFWGDGITPYVEKAKGPIYGMWMERNISTIAWRSAPLFWGTPTMK
jgi:hypothetical protein